MQAYAYKMQVDNEKAGYSLIGTGVDTLNENDTLKIVRCICSLFLIFKAKLEHYYCRFKNEV